MNFTKSLPEFASENFSPTEDQLGALNQLQRFFEGNSPCFLLKGYAGTGKTWLLNVITTWLEKYDSKVVLMAPTGRAARVLSGKTGRSATTIHKGIYNFNNLREITVHSDGKKKFKFRYDLNTDPLPGTVFIIDEASMISDKTSESDFFIFGSGKLLSDLITYTAPGNLDNHVKILFSGDPAQLPPVGDPISGALDSDYLKQQFGITPNEYELTGVVRQSADNDILNLATSLREQLRTGKITGFCTNGYSRNVQIIPPEEVTTRFMQVNPELSTTSAIIVSFGNKHALDYNLAQRAELFPGIRTIQKGDNLMIVQNNYNYKVSLLNGTLVKVMEVGNDPEVKGNMLTYDKSGKECRVSHTFRRVTIEVEENNGKILVSCLILEDFLYSPDPQPDYAQNIALYLDFKIRHPDLIPGTPAFTDTLRTDPWFNALKVKFGYAVTCHKAQGGEWDTVFLNLNYSMGQLNKSFIRWVYTAVTRARQHLFVFNLKVESGFSQFRYDHKLLPGEKITIDQRKIIVENPGDFELWAASSGIDLQPQFIRDRVREIWAVAMEFNLSITRKSPESFCEVLSFRLDAKTASLKFWFNARNKFTSIQIFAQGTNDVVWAGQLKDIFLQPVQLYIREDTPPSGQEKTQKDIERFFNDSSGQQLEKLYLAIAPPLADKGVDIERIEHLQFHEVYYFVRNGEVAAIKFYYEGRFMFTFAQPLLNECNSNQLLNDLNDVLNSLK